MCIRDSLMPFLDTPKGKSDGGYAVADYRKVQPALGTMEELASLCSACHEKKMSVCMDFVMNHTSEDHEWAKQMCIRDSLKAGQLGIREHQESKC